VPGGDSHCELRAMWLRFSTSSRDGFDRISAASFAAMNAAEQSGEFFVLSGWMVVDSRLKAFRTTLGVAAALSVMNSVPNLSPELAQRRTTLAVSSAHFISRSFDFDPSASSSDAFMLVAGAYAGSTPPVDFADDIVFRSNCIRDVVVSENPSEELSDDKSSLCMCVCVFERRLNLLLLLLLVRRCSVCRQATQPMW
jgi:hypothetical protein